MFYTTIYIYNNYTLMDIYIYICIHTDATCKTFFLTVYKGLSIMPPVSTWMAIGA